MDMKYDVGMNSKETPVVAVHCDVCMRMPTIEIPCPTIRDNESVSLYLCKECLQKLANELPQ